MNLEEWEYRRNRSTLSVIIALIGVFLALNGCGLLKERQEPEPDLTHVVKEPLPPEKNEELLAEVGSNWLYGNGLGNTAITAGSVFVFPPYALYVVGNGILWLSGYEPIYVSDALPDEEREEWNSIYDSVSGAPGRVTAAVAGKEFRKPEVAKEKLMKVLRSGQEEDGAQHQRQE